MVAWSVEKLGHVPADRTDAWEVFGRPEQGSTLMHAVSFNVTLPAARGDARNERIVWTMAGVVADSLDDFSRRCGGSAAAQRSPEGRAPKLVWTLEMVGRREDANRDIWCVFGQPEVPGEPLSTVIFHVTLPTGEGDEANEAVARVVAGQVAKSLSETVSARRQ